MTSKQHEAEILAGAIRAYWHAHGKCPLVWVDRQLASSSATETRFIYAVRSDMVGGWPRPHAAAAFPKPALKIVPAPKSESASPLAVLAALGPAVKRDRVPRAF